MVSCAVCWGAQVGRPGLLGHERRLRPLASASGNATGMSSIWQRRCGETELLAILTLVADAEEYVDRAADRIVEVLLDEQHAVVNPELQAPISEAGHRGSGLNIDPHHVTTALRRLSLSGVVATQRSTTRGGPPPLEHSGVQTDLGLMRYGVANVGVPGNGRSTPSAKTGSATCWP